MVKAPVSDEMQFKLGFDGQKFTVGVNKASGQLATFGKVVDKSAIELAKLEKKLLGFGLAALFTGMAIKNASQQALNATFKTFQEVTEGTMLYNQTLGRVSAAFQFLKFSIADAFLASSAGQFLLDMLVDIFDFVSGLPDEVQSGIAGFLLFTTVMGGLLMIIGQAYLGFLGLTSLMGVKALPLAAKLKSAFLLIAKAFVLIAILAGAIMLIVKVWNSEASFFEKFLTTFVIIMITLLVIAALFGIALTLPMMLAIALAGTLVAAFLLAPKEFELAFLKAIAAISKAIRFALAAPIAMIIGAIDSILKLAGFGGIGVNVSRKLDDFIQGGVGGGLSEKISTLEGEIEAQRAAKAEQEQGTSKKEDIKVFVEKVVTDSKEGLMTELREETQFNLGAGTGG